MTNRMTAVGFYPAASTERRALTVADVRDEHGTIVGLDDTRAAQLGRLSELPALGEVLSAWSTQRQNDECEDYAIDFADLLLAESGAYRRATTRLDESRGLTVSMPGDLPMTYRTFGNVLRHYCASPRNVAQCLIQLPTSATGPGHTRRTMRANFGPVGFDSPRAVAYNAYLDRKKAVDSSVARIDEGAVTEVILRTRLLRVPTIVDGQVVPQTRRTVIGAVTPTHCLQNGDDDKLIAALSLAFAGHTDAGRAIAFRGIEESELRAVFPALEVQIPGAGSSKWCGYVTARNSESGKKSWSISAGLYRTDDGASVACEAIVRTGRHVGVKVAERMVEVSEGARDLLAKLIETASELAGRKWEGTRDEFFKRLRAALAGTPLETGEACMGIAWALGEEIADLNGPITIGLLLNVLGRAAAQFERRVDARPIEVMLGRLLVDGWKEFKAVGTDGDVDDDAGEA